MNNLKKKERKKTKEFFVNLTLCTRIYTQKIDDDYKFSYVLKLFTL